MIERIKNDLDELSLVLDKSKCCVDIYSLNDGYAFDVKTYSSEYCPFRMEVTSEVFDLIVANRFAVGDVWHGDFDFNSVAISIASGKMSEVEHRGFLFFKSSLKIILESGGSFYVPGQIRLRSLNKSRVYSSYVL